MKVLYIFAVTFIISLKVLKIVINTLLYTNVLLYQQIMLDVMCFKSKIV